MSCCFRHLDALLAEAGIEVTPQNWKQVDEAIHRAIGVVYKDCPSTLKAFK